MFNKNLQKNENKIKLLVSKSKISDPTKVPNLTPDIAESNETDPDIVTQDAPIPDTSEGNKTKSKRK